VIPALVTAAGLWLAPDAPCMVYVYPRVPCQRLVPVAAVGVWEWPCVDTILSPAENNPRANCPCEVYVQHFTIPEGGSLVIPFEFERVEVQGGYGIPGLNGALCFSPQGGADINGDGDVGTDADIEAFFACLTGNCCPTCTADYDRDGDGGTEADILAFFECLGGGCAS
jgi:hypothetical protein